jgi:hypothetical protein
MLTRINVIVMLPRKKVEELVPKFRFFFNAVICIAVAKRKRYRPNNSCIELQPKQVKVGKTDHKE